MDSSGQRGGICLYMACLQSIGVRWFLVSARTKTMSRFGALAFGFYSANLQKAERGDTFSISAARSWLTCPDCKFAVRFCFRF